jgi:hydroxymethylpyrimidine/phosphomethylpyrimidine kinase
VGITPSLAVAGGIIDHIKGLNPAVRVILDPVIRASSGVFFWDGLAEWEEVAARCFLVTPNREEIGWLYPGQDVDGCCATLSGSGVNIFLKGGHHEECPGRDYLWMGGDVEVLDAVGGKVWPKHGSGCVLSSALAANLALGYSLPVAAVRAKRYIERFLASNETLLGWH